MKSEDIIARILNCRGQYISLTIKTEVTPAAAHKQKKLEKITSNKFRAGIQFKNLKSVKDAIGCPRSFTNPKSREATRNKQSRSNL